MGRPKLKKVTAKCTAVCSCGKTVKVAGCEVGSTHVPCPQCGATVIIRLSAGCFVFSQKGRVEVNDGWLHGADRIEEE
jgi:predicted RNA-binding Zn-ribbon protein involved in translation (DUF1610 family)